MTRKPKRYTPPRENSGAYSAVIDNDVNNVLNLYCCVVNLNKSAVVNRAVKEWLQQKFEKLKEDDK